MSRRGTGYQPVVFIPIEPPAGSPCHRALVLFFICLTLVGCARTKQTPNTQSGTSHEPMSLDGAMRLIDARAAWADHPPIDVPRHPAEKYLAGWTIVLDPGHGGDDGGASDARAAHKRGTAGVREADVNLRVALLLRRLLSDAGVNVIMTRAGDDSIGLRERAQVANEADADLFIGLHHNAVDKPETNYTSVWYHGPVERAEHELDVARHIAHALGRELRTDVGKTSPLLDDKLMYNTGFGVLRACRVPAILLESSFYTNPAEEQRLRDAGYNLREAYAVYVGLCEYAYGGRPTQSPPQIAGDGGPITLTTTLDPGLPAWWGADRNRIITSSIKVELNGRPMEIVAFDPKSRLLTAALASSAGELESLAALHAVVTIHHQNLFKHHNYPQRFELRAGTGSSISLQQVGADRAPATRRTTATQPARGS